MLPLVKAGRGSIPAFGGCIYDYMCGSEYPKWFDGNARFTRYLKHFDGVDRPKGEVDA